MLEAVYEEEGDYIKDLNHPSYSIVFVPFIKQAILGKNEATLRLISDFMERMASSDDELVPELLAVSVLESMINEREIINYLKPYLKAETLNILSVMEKATGWS